jgi:electron transport complex protein RnfG
VTNEQIAQKEETAQTQAMLSAFPSAVSFELMDIKIPAEYDRIKNVYSAMDEQGNQLGVLVDVISKGRVEELGLLVGLSKDGTIAGLVLKTEAGTPWLGIMVENSAFTDQFAGVSFETPFTVIRADSANEHDIQAVSGATISSRGVAYSVNAAAAFYADMLGMEIVMPTPAPGPTQAQPALPTDRNIKPEDEVRAQAFPEAYSFDLLDVNIPESYAFIDSFYTAYDALGNDIGVVAQITANGYNYGINYTVGFSRQGVITGIVFGENLTNPGLGSELDVPYFTEQFIGLPFDKELRVSMLKPAPNGEIDAVSGATVMAVDVTYYISETARFYTDVIGGTK